MGSTLSAQRCSTFARYWHCCFTCKDGAVAVERDAACDALSQHLLDNVWQLHALEGVCRRCSASSADTNLDATHMQRRSRYAKHSWRAGSRLKAYPRAAGSSHSDLCDVHHAKEDC